MSRTVRNHTCCGEKAGRDHLSHPETYRAWDRAEAKGDRRRAKMALTQMAERDDSDPDFLPHPNR